MTFKIDSVGFYKNRKGEKVEITEPFEKTRWIGLDSNGSFSFSAKDGTSSIHPDFDIISKWVETPELEDFEEKPSSAQKMWAVADNQGEWLEVTSRKEAGEIAAKWLNETPTTTIDIWEKISCYTASVDVQEVEVV